MSKPQQVQEYLQKHKIGNLFEDLMAKVVSDMPDEPIIYLMQTLERKATRMGTKTGVLRRSMGDLAHMRSTSPDRNATWTGGVAVAKDRPYTKPWQTNTKRVKPKKPGETEPRRPKTAGERPDWDGKVKDAASNLDDFWGDSDAISKHQRRSGSPTRAQPRKSWAAEEEEEDEDLLYRSQGYVGPRRLYSTDSDPLAGEFGLTKERETPSREVAPVVSSGRVHGLAVDTKKHRQQLARMVNNRHQQVDSGIDDDHDLEADDALELLEDIDDLRSEGVRGLKKSGVKVRPMRRSGVVNEPQVRVSICARCAKVMDGPQPSEQAEGVGYGELPDYDAGSDREFPESRPQSSRYTDDEFESVSQVSGPRRPVWNNDDSDSEVIAPRKSVSRSQDMYRSIDSTTAPKSLTGHSAFNRTYTEGVGDTDSDMKRIPEVEKKEGEEEPVAKNVTFRADDKDPHPTTSTARQDDDEGASTAVSLQGVGWAAPSTDYDSDFSTPAPRASRGSRGRARQYQGQY